MKTKGEGLDWQSIQERLASVQETFRPEGGFSENERVAILERRARELAAPPPASEVLLARETLIIFRNGADRFALNLLNLAEILPKPRLAIVPGAPPLVAGLVQIRGEVRPVYHLRLLLGLAQNSEPDLNYILLLRHLTREFGIGAEAIDDIRQVGREDGKPARAARGYAGWVTDDLVPVLDAASLLTEKE